MDSCEEDDRGNEGVFGLWQALKYVMCGGGVTGSIMKLRSYRIRILKCKRCSRDTSKSVYKHYTPNSTLNQVHHHLQQPDQIRLEIGQHESIEMRETCPRTAKIIGRHQQLQAQLRGNVHVGHICRILVLLIVVQILAHLLQYQAAVANVSQ